MLHRDVKTRILSEMARTTDESMSDAGFRRSARSLVYKRKCDAGRQEIAIELYKSRLSGASQLCTVSPLVGLVFPAVNRIFKDAVSSFTPRPDGSYTLSQAVGLVGPEFTLKEWRVPSESMIADTIEDVRSFLIAHALPFLERFISPCELVSGWPNDRRLPRGDTWSLMLAAAALTVGDNQRCHEILEERFYGRPGRQKKFAAAIEYLTIRADA